MSAQIGIRVPLKTFRVDASVNGITFSGNVSGLITRGASATIGATLAASQGAGQINQNFTLTYADDSALNGAARFLGLCDYREQSFGGGFDRTNARADAESKARFVVEKNGVAIERLAKRLRTLPPVSWRREISGQDFG